MKEQPRAATVNRIPQHRTVYRSLPRPRPQQMQMQAPQQVHRGRVLLPQLSLAYLQQMQVPRVHVRPVQFERTPQTAAAFAAFAAARAARAAAAAVVQEVWEEVEPAQRRSLGLDLSGR